MGSTSGTGATMPGAMPRARAPARPVAPPPRTIANTLNAPRTPASLSGRTTHSRSEVAAKNLFSGTLLTRIVVGVTGIRKAAAPGDGAKASFTTGARTSASELLLGKAAVVLVV